MSISGRVESAVTRILESIDDGVVVVDRGGRIVTWNAAAGRILGRDEAPATGTVFAQIFLLAEGLDAFSQTILDAVASDADMGRRVVEIEIDGSTRTLGITTTRLQDDAEADDVEAIVAVFSDLTEVAALRASEVELGRQVEAQFDELRDAYRTVEERNATLAATVRRANVAQAAAAVMVLFVLGVLGAWAWWGGAEIGGTTAAATAEEAMPSGQRTWQVQAQPIRLTTSVTGKIAAARIRNMVSPATGTVRAVHVRDGERVDAGDVLVEINVAVTRRQLRAAKATAFETAARVEELAGWESGREMTAAKRGERRAAEALDRQRRRTEETAFLLDEGVIGADQHEAAMEQYDGLREDHLTAIAEIEAVRALGGEQAKATAALAHQNALEEVAELEAAVDAALVRAPEPGMVMAAPPQSGGNRAADAVELEEGVQVSEGDVLLRVADVETLAVVGEVGEIEIASFDVGQAVRVTGDAFPDIDLDGVLTAVASHSDAPGGAVARFSVRAEVREVDAAVRDALRIGMTADMHIVVRDDPAVVVVPIAAVTRRSGEFTVQVQGAGEGGAETVVVQPGATTVDGVEIVRGLAHGDTLVLPP